MKNILLPTDFSDNSRNAIIYALDFFKENPCHFVFLNVQKSSDFILDDLMSSPTGSSVYQSILTDNKKQLQTFIEPIQRAYEMEDYTFSSLADYDNLTDSMNQAISAEKIDLIVMGTNGATGATEKLFGSNTLNVIRKVDLPLLAIPEGFRYEGLSTILFTTHNSDDFTYSKIEPLKQIIYLKHPVLKILELVDEFNPQNNESCLPNLFKNIPYQNHVLHGIPTPIGIDVFTQLNSVQMHAMFVERETFLNRFIFGSDINKINYKTRVPLLILHK